MSSSTSAVANLTGFPAIYDICGNSELEQAQVVFVADVPSNPAICNMNAYLINQIWRDHTVLVEHVPAGVTQSVSLEKLSHRLTVVKEVSGWDLADVKTQAMNLELAEQFFYVDKQLILDKLEQEDWRFFCKSDESFDQFCRNHLSRFKIARQHFVDLLHEGQQSIFCVQLLSLIAQVKVQHRAEIQKLYEQSFRLRQASLIETIAKSLIVHGKVIICLSGNFVIRNPRLVGENYDITALEEFLKQKKYVVINPKLSPLKLTNQPHCWGSRTKILTATDLL